MNYFERRKLKKAKKHILHESRHARYMREDIVDAAEIQKLLALEIEIEEAWASEDTDRMEEAYNAISEQMKKVYPAPAGSPKVRENVEIVAVALAVALGFRTYFIQPFKIPTGSMQPTLNGIRIDDEQHGAKLMDRFPLWIIGYAFTGIRYKEVRAKSSGPIARVGAADNYELYQIGGNQGKKYKILGEMKKTFLQDLDLVQLHTGRMPYVNKGDILASGRVLSGDHILVNKMKYNFARPKRGEIVVFNTSQIKHPQIKADAFYIKRLVGMPGETINLSSNGYLHANGERVTSPEIFNWTFADKYADIKTTKVNENDIRYLDREYNIEVEKSVPRDQGPYVFTSTGVLRDQHKKIALEDRQYLFFGDNTLSSLDGRYFKGVERGSVIGPAFAVYWPFKSRAKILTNP